MLLIWLLDNVQSHPEIAAKLKLVVADFDLIGQRTVDLARWKVPRVLAHTDDFARHNPIRRWWGGTKLTNKNLWRWDQDNHVLVAP